MENYSMHLPSYSIGSKVYDKIPEICEPYGTKVIAIGGHKAINAAKDKIVKACEKSNLEILDFIWYGGEATYENVEELMKNPLVQQADMIFTIGGGKSTDTGKSLGIKANKPVFSFPTIASNCSACTSVSIMYYPDGRFKEPFFFAAPPVHAFIDTEIIADSPKRYMWAGIGDTYAKHFESSISSRDEEVPHYIALGVNIARMCYEPMLKYGRKALEDIEKHLVTSDFEQVLLSIIVSTAAASILLTNDKIIDYNTGLAHAIFYALTTYPHIEKNHLHGEVVAFGVLVLLLVDNDEENFKKLYEFNKAVGLPVRLEDIEISRDDIDKVAKITVAMKDIEHNPYEITSDMVKAALIKLENI